MLSKVGFDVVFTFMLNELLFILRSGGISFLKAVRFRMILSLTKYFVPKELERS